MQDSYNNNYTILIKGMEFTMVMDRQTQHSNDVTSPQTDIRVNTGPIRITRYFVEVNKIILKFIHKAAKEVGFS